MPPDIDEIRNKFIERDYVMSEHGSSRAALRKIISTDIEEAASNSELIEDYPDDKYGPSCLLYGETTSGRVLHIHISYPPDIKVITVYEPSLDKWEDDLKTRKKHDE